MIGARHAGGSTTSKGGDSSPSNWVIVGRRPLKAAVFSILPEKRGFYENSLSVITTILPRGNKRKKFYAVWNASRSGKTRGFIDSMAVPAQNERWLPVGRGSRPSPEIYQPSG